MVPAFQISVFEKLDDVSVDWPRAAKAQNGAHFHAFQTVTFLTAWTNSFGRSGRRSLHFVEVRDGAGHPVLFVPLCITRRTGAAVLTFIDNDAADYNAPILFPVEFEWTREVIEGLWRQIASHLPAYDVLELDKMPADIDGLVNPLALLSNAAHSISCHGTDLRRPWSEIDSAYPNRKTVLRSARLLNDKAPLEFCVARQRDEMDEAVRAMLRQKQQRFEQTRVPGFETDRDKYDFFNEGTYLFAEKQMVVLFYLKAGDLILATNWGLVAGRRFHGIMTSFEGGDWAKFSPGSILNYRVVEWLHREGFEWHDLGVGDEPWKLKAARAFNLSQRRSAATFNGWIYLQRRAAMVRLRATQFWQTIRPLKWIFFRRLRQSTLALLGIDILLDVVLAVLATA